MKNNPQNLNFEKFQRKLFHQNRADQNRAQTNKERPQKITEKRRLTDRTNANRAVNQIAFAVAQTLNLEL